MAPFSLPADEAVSWPAPDGSVRLFGRKHASNSSIDQGGGKRRVIHRVTLQHYSRAAPCSRYRRLLRPQLVPPGRRLVGRRKVVLDFSPIDRLIVKKLALIERPPIDALKLLW